MPFPNLMPFLGNQNSFQSLTDKCELVYQINVENDLDKLQDSYVRYLLSIALDPLRLTCVFFWPLLWGPTQGELRPGSCRCCKPCLTSGPPSASLNTHSRALLLMPQLGIPQISARFIGCAIQNSSCLPLPSSGGKLHNTTFTPPPSISLGSDFPMKCCILSFCLRLFFVGNLGWEILFSTKFKFSDCFPPWLLREKKGRSQEFLSCDRWIRPQEVWKR